MDKRKHEKVSAHSHDNGRQEGRIISIPSLYSTVFVTYLSLLLSCQNRHTTEVVDTLGMASQNRAAVLFGKMDLRVVPQGPMKEPEPGEVRIKMKHVGICKIPL